MLVLIRFGSSPGRFCIQTRSALFRITQRQTHWQAASRKRHLSPFKITASDTSDSRALTSHERFWFWFTEAEPTQFPIIPQEKRKWQTEMENKRRQLEDERRALQHLKSKVLRERWLLQGPDGPDQNQNQDPEQVRSQLEEDEARTRTLEESIRSLEQEVSKLETGPVSQTITHSVVNPTPDPVVEVKGHSRMELGGAKLSGQAIQEVKVHKSLKVSKSREDRGEMKKAMYSVEIKVERDKVTGETRVLSTNTKLPVDLSDQGVKVYEDEQKVVHEMNGDDAHLLSSVEVEELIHKAGEASVMSHSVTTATSRPTGEVRRESDLLPEPEPGSTRTPGHAPSTAAAITGLETTAGGEPDVAEASADNPVTMVFMGYQDVEDEDETRKLLGLQGTVKAELVLINDGDGKVDPPASAAPPSAAPPSAAPPTPTTAPETVMASNGEAAVEGRAVAGKKEQPCKCCSIM
ncbi:paralemmin 1a isoform X2 [Poeciliopsis prolifica]|uniref:paralemmin 1a isoform X2 n=1 Tax=Poeciliopsis prolifica TaxID=188132 RepID=UPI0024139192|nr:paralemmin 1a isoform X2 [Poeciliopsis prolifica]